MKIGRIASIVVILISVGSLYCIRLLRQDRDELRVEKIKITESLVSAKAQIVRTETKVQDAIATLPAVSNALVKVVAEFETTKKALAGTTEERDKLKANLADTQQKLPSINTELVAAKEALKKAEGTIASQAAQIATIAGFKKQIAALMAENRALGSKIEVVLAEIKRLEFENDELRKTPINCRGLVAGVENRWNFIILDIGQDQKVRKNSHFLVYRNKTFICKAQVLSVSENTAVAEVLPEFRRGDPRIGDIAIH